MFFLISHSRREPSAPPETSSYSLRGDQHRDQGMPRWPASRCAMWPTSGSNSTTSPPSPSELVAIKLCFDAMPDMHEQWTRPAVSKLQTGAMLLVSHNLTVASTALDTKAPVSWGNHCRHVTPDVWPAGHERLVVRTMGARASGGPLDMVGLSATSYSEMDASAHPASR